MKALKEKAYEFLEELEKANYSSSDVLLIVGYLQSIAIAESIMAVMESTKSSKSDA